MTRLESLKANHQLLKQRIAQQKQFVSAHQLRVWRNRLKRYAYVIGLFEKNKDNNQLTLI